MSNENDSKTQTPPETATGAVLRAEAKQTDLRSFLDYREYLAAWLQARKAMQASYSGAMFAKKAGIQSHTLLGMVIRGDRNLTPNTTRAFIRGLGLGARDALYFEKLVLFNQAKKPDDRAYYFAQLQTVLNQNKDHPIAKLSSYSRYLSHWYMVAIREMAALDDFKEDPHWIVAALKNRISVKQAKEALATLFELELLVRATQENGDTRITLKEPTLDVQAPEKIDFAIRSYHREYLKITEHALDHEGPQERLFNSVTLGIPESQISDVHAEIESFRHELLRKYGTLTQGAEQVVSINIQFLKLTQKDRKSV